MVLAHLPYEYEEPLFIIQYITRLLDLNSVDCLSNMKTALKQSGHTLSDDNRLVYAYIYICKCLYHITIE
jgi:hypothetical protein